MKNAFQIPVQAKMLPTIENLPIEIFHWGKQPDHFKFDIPHCHKFDELLFFKKGGGIHEIDFIKYDIGDFSVHFIKAGIIHFLQRDCESSGFTIAFDSHCLETNKKHRVILPTLAGKQLPGPVLNLRESQYNELVDITNLLTKQTIEVGDYFIDRCFLSGFEMLINKVALHFKAKATREKNIVLTAKEQLMKSFLYLLAQNARSQHSVFWYASQLNISASYLRKICLEIKGYSPKDLLNQQLLAEAKKLLYNTNYSCKKLALELGFKSSSRFSNFFKHHTGFSPIKYRQLL